MNFAGLEGRALGLAILAGFLVVNALAYWLMGADKKRAGTGKPRIREASFFRLAVAGGWPAILLAMRRFRHKTQKRSFRVGLAVAIAINIALVAFAAVADTIL